MVLTEKNNCSEKGKKTTSKNGRESETNKRTNRPRPYLETAGSKPGWNKRNGRPLQKCSIFSERKKRKKRSKGAYRGWQGNHQWEKKIILRNKL